MCAEPRAVVGSKDDQRVFLKTVLADGVERPVSRRLLIRPSTPSGDPECGSETSSRAKVPQFCFKPALPGLQSGLGR